ncbi:MAG: chemotaxis protein CheW, partial [Pseudomonas putida]
MTQTRHTSTRPQMALQSYLDGLLQEATEAEDLLEPPAAPDEFAEAVREEQARDARQPARPVPAEAPGSLAPRPFAEPRLAVLPSVMPVEAPVVTVVEQEVIAEAAIPVLVEEQTVEPAVPL